MAEQDVNNSVAELLEQLQSKGTPDKKEEQKVELSKDNLEEFLLQYSGKLVKGSVEFVDDIKSYVSSSPDAKEIESVASLISSSAAAIESLNKILMTNKNLDAKFKLKTMDIESRKELQAADIQGKVLMNREELLKKLVDESKIINIEVETQEVLKTS